MVYTCTSRPSLLQLRRRDSFHPPPNPTVWDWSPNSEFSGPGLASCASSGRASAFLSPRNVRMESLIYIHCLSGGLRRATLVRRWLGIMQQVGTGKRSWLTVEKGQTEL